MLKNILIIIAIFIVGMVGGILSNHILWFYFDVNQLEPGPVFLTEVKQVHIQENVALVNAAMRAAKTVVAIKTETRAGKILEGSGLSVTTDGLIVTLAELVPHGSSFSFFINDKPVSFQILKRDIDKNLALVKISDPVLTTAVFADLEELRIGERVFLVGAAFKDKTPFKVVNQGIIRVLNQNLIQTNIFENQSLAGSPLFNIKGEILGINIIDSAGRVNVIPVSTIRTFVEM